KRRARIVVDPARLSIVQAAVDAEMGPAIRIPGSSRPIPAQTAAAAVEPHCKPRLRRLVIQNNWATGISEGALAASVRKSGEGVATVSGDGCSGTGHRGGVSTTCVVVRNDNLSGIIRISRTKRCGLSDVWKSLRSGD